MFKWEIKTEALTDAKPAAIWALWTHVPSWPTWSQDLDWARLEGPFTSGTGGSLKPKGWPISKFSLSQVDHNKRFETKARMPLTNLIFDYRLISEGGKTRLKYKVTVKGLLAPLLYFTMRPMIKKGLPTNIRKFAEMAAR